MDQRSSIAGVLLASILLLALAAVGSSKGWQLSQHLGDAGFWGSILGAVVGGGIAILGQKITIEEARKQKAEEKRARDLASASSFLFKLVRIYSNINNMSRYFTYCLEDDPNARGLKGEPWMFYRPLVSVPDRVVFSSEEMGLLLQLADDGLFSKCMALDDIHNGFLASVTKLGELRTAIVEKLEPESVVADIVSGHIAVSQKQRAEMNAVNSLIVRLRKSAGLDEARSGSAVDEASALFRQKIGSTIRTARKTELPDVIV